MRCEEVRPLISAGLDGELDGVRTAQVKMHLTTCVLCSAEREALAETVQLLRAVPEAEPPAELRRRIGVALLDAERAAERRWLGLGLLLRPRTAGWAWGAALGAVVATVALVTTRGPEPQLAAVPPIASMTAPIVAPPVAPTLRNSSPAGNESLAPRKAPAARPTAARPADPVVAPALEPAASTTLARSSASSAHPGDGTGVIRVASPTSARSPRTRATRNSPPAVRRPGSTAGGPARIVPATPLPGSGSPSTTAPPMDESPMVDRMDAAPAPGTAAPEHPDGGEWPGTAGMTQMASGTMDTATPTVASDSLSELRRRLIDRPLLVPELGELKPAGGSHAGRDGWIRF